MERGEGTGKSEVGEWAWQPATGWIPWLNPKIHQWKARIVADPPCLSLPTNSHFWSWKRLFMSLWDLHWLIVTWVRRLQWEGNEITISASSSLLTADHWPYGCYSPFWCQTWLLGEGKAGKILAWSFCWIQPQDCVQCLTISTSSPIPHLSTIPYRLSSLIMRWNNFILNSS